jgi:hypothetical protein
LAKDIAQEDHAIIEKVHTFDKIYGMGSQRQLQLTQDFLREHPDYMGPTMVGDSDTTWLLMAHHMLMQSSLSGLMDSNPWIMSTGFSVSSILRDASFATCVYHVPIITISNTFDEEAQDSKEVSNGLGILNVETQLETKSVASRPTSPPLSASAAGLLSAGLNSPSLFSETRSGAGLGTRKSIDIFTDTNSNVGTKTESGLQPLKSSPGFVLRLASVIRTDSPKERIGLTLHRFFERALSSITDCEISLSSSTSFDAFPSGRSPMTPTTPMFPTSRNLYDIPTLKPIENVGHDVLQTIKEILEGKMDCGSDILLSGIKESVCYVKIRTSDRFLLVFLPAYPSKPDQTSPIVLFPDDSDKRRLGTKMTVEDRSKVRYLTVTVMECRRPTPKSPSSEWRARTFAFDEGYFNIVSNKLDDAAVDELSWKLMFAHDAGKPDDEIPDGSVLIQGGFGLSATSDNSFNTRVKDEDAVGGWMVSGTTSKKSRWESSGDPKAGPSDFALNFLVDVTEAYEAALCRTIYSTFLQGVQVESADLDRALKVCVETSIDLDLTGYLNIQTLKRKHLGSRGLRYALPFELPFHKLHALTIFFMSPFFP